MNFMDELKKSKLIAIMRKVPSDLCLDAAEALYEGGVRFIEVTFDQEDSGDFAGTLEAIKLLSREFGKTAYIGAGTVLNRKQAEMAAAAGASYLVMPNVEEELLQVMKRRGLHCIPGAMSPTEICRAWEAGADCVKVFPAGTLGTDYVRAVKGPLSHIPLAAVGGINVSNLGDFLHAGCVAAGVGENLVNRRFLLERQFKQIKILAEDFVRKANQ